MNQLWLQELGFEHFIMYMAGFFPILIISVHPTKIHNPMPHRAYVHWHILKVLPIDAQIQVFRCEMLAMLLFKTF